MMSAKANSRRFNRTYRARIAAAMITFIFPLTAVSWLTAQAGANELSDYTQAVLIDHPTVFLPLDESGGTTAYDDSGNGNDATYVGSVAYGQPGVLPDGSELSIGVFGDSGYVSGGQVAPMLGASDRTVELWFNASSQGTIFHGGQPGHTQSFDLTVLDSGPGGCGSPSGPGLYLRFWDDDLFFPGALDNGSWHYLAVTVSQGGTVVSVDVDGQEPSGYVWNGSCYTSSPVSQPFTMPYPLDTGSGGYGVGEDDGTGLGGLTGDVALMAIYPTALSESELNAHFNAASGSASPSCDTPYTDLIQDPGFETPSVGSGPPPSNPVTNGWYGVTSSSGTPTTTTSASHCGISSGQVLGGYWVQDLPTTFDPAKPFEFSFWFYPSALGNQVSLVANWDRGTGEQPVYTNLVSMSLTASVSGGFQTQSVIGNKSVTGSPVVSANVWHHFDAISNGRNKEVSITVDGQSAGSAKLSSVASTDPVTLLMGATGGPNSTGPTDVLYDDVYVGVDLATTTTVTSSATSAATGEPITYFASVAAAGGGLPPYGVVSFFDDGSPIPGCSDVPLGYLVVQLASCDDSYAAPGTHKITATFQSEVGFDSSTSPTFVEDVVGAPKVKSVTPNNASFQGGQTVTLTGKNFVPDMTVYVDGVPAGNLDVVSSTDATATVPETSMYQAGITQLTVATSAGSSQTPFTYFVPQIGLLVSYQASSRKYDRCTASVVHTEAGDVVLTAAHCVSDSASQKKGKTVDGQLFSAFAFAPGFTGNPCTNPKSLSAAFTCGNAPYGVWSASSVGVPEPWLDQTVPGPNNSQIPDHSVDYAVLLMSSNGGTEIESAVGGGLGLGFDQSRSDDWQAFGQPGAGLVSCSGVPGDYYAGGPGADNLQFTDCNNLVPGSSGGPWIDTSTGLVGGDTATSDAPIANGAYLDDTAYNALFAGLCNSESSC